MKVLNYLILKVQVRVIKNNLKNYVKKIEVLI